MTRPRRLTPASRAAHLKGWWERVTREMEVVCAHLADPDTRLHQAIGRERAEVAVKELRFAIDSMLNGLMDPPPDVDLPFLD